MSDRTTYKRKGRSPITLIRIYEPGEFRSEYQVPIYEFAEGNFVNPLRLRKEDFDKKVASGEYKEIISRADKDLREMIEMHDLCLENPTYQTFMIYLSENATIGGFQAPPTKIEELKIDYFNDTEEEISDEHICSLSDKTFGKAMRLYFPLPDGKTVNDIISILPQMPKLCYLPGHSEYSLPVEKDGQVCITNLQYVRTLLRMGFRHGKNHNKDQISSFSRR
jgi:hypothetical protein